MSPVRIGYDLVGVGDLEQEIKNYVKERQFAYVSVPLVHPRNIRFAQTRDAQALTRSDLVLRCQQWSQCVVGKATADIDVDSEIAHIAVKSEAILREELKLAAHIGVRTVIVPLKSINCLKLARVLKQSIAKDSDRFNVLLKLPATFSINIHKTVSASVNVESDPWEWWNRFRLICDIDRHFKIALEFPSCIPSESEIDRWLGEPVRCLVLPTTAFIMNNHGYPVLPRRMQKIVQQFLMLDVSVIISGKPEGETDLTAYKTYVEHIFERGVLSPKFPGYEDVLQMPLQPLADNLESEIYEVFEMDPVKYKRYQDAIQQALEDRVPTHMREHTRQTIMVVGAGRGPLVQAALNAAQLSHIQATVYAIEKNTMAINTLCSLNNVLWNNSVQIVDVDMRVFKPTEKADILVSELLGSFADNELSPECLDGAQHLLKPDGVSIPCSYAAWLAPLHSPKLTQEIRQMQSAERTMKFCFETMYVVHLVNCFQIAPAKKCWTFNHPKNEGQSNERHVTLRFQAEQNCLLTGFAGFFDVVLYKDINLSIEPRSHTEHMISWFPAYLPIQNHIPIKVGDNIELSVWRCVNSRFVWYEWCVNQPAYTHLHNEGGHAYKITL